MGLVVKPNTFSPGATIVAAEHNSNFDTLYDEFNGSISNANISNTAGIAESKLDFDTTSGHDHDGTDSKKVDLSAPGAIGGTTPAAGAFTTLAGTVLSASTSLAITGTGDDSVVVTGIKDEDAMGSNSATHLSTQQSIKAYVDTKVGAITSWNVNTDSVYSDAGVETYTDLDLSAKVGSNSALVILKVATNHAGGHTLAFRRNGDSSTFATVSITDAISSYVTVPTDSSGIIEWIRTSGANGTITINLEGYIKV